MGSIYTIFGGFERMWGIWNAIVCIVCDYYLLSVWGYLLITIGNLSFYSLPESYKNFKMIPSTFPNIPRGGLYCSGQ